MNKKYIISLTKSELILLEKLLLKNGSVVNVSSIYNEIGKDKQQAKNIIGKLVKKGWLIRVKRGIFIISDISNRGSIQISQLAIAQIIDDKSYISFEGALQYYGLYDQYLKTITSIGKKRSYYKQVKNWIFQFIKVKNKLYSDFNEHSIDGQLVKIATLEKALLDFLEYKRSVYSIDLVIEKLKNYKDDIDLEKLIFISKKYSLSCRRVLGFIFDIIGFNSKVLYNEIKSNKNHSFMTSTSKNFNAKWRLYIDNYFKN